MIYLIIATIALVFFLLMRSDSYQQLKDNIIKLLFIAAGFLCFYLLIRIAPVLIAGASGILVAFAPAITRLIFNFGSIMSILRGALPNLFLKKTKSKKMSLSEARETLEVEVGATKNDINKSYREKMKKYHPDHGGSNDLSIKINEAKKILLEELENEQN